MKKNFLLFDFDGVIADSFALAFKVSKMISPRLTEEEFGQRFEGNISDWQTPASPDPETYRPEVNFFVEYFSRMQKEVELVPGMAGVIKKLQKKYTLVVVSSTITSPITMFLEKAGLANHFDKILGNDVHRSKVEKIKIIFERYGIGADNCVFITDTLGDMREAAETGIGSIGVAWGFNKSETLAKGKPFRILKTPSEMVGAVADYFSAFKN